MIPNPDDPIPPLDVLWTIPLWPEPWAARALDLTEDQIQAYRRKSGLPSAQLGKHHYYLRESVLLWFQQQERQAP